MVIAIALIAIFDKPNPVRKVLNETWLPFFVISLVALVIAPSFINALKTYLALLSYASVFALAITLIRNEEDYGRWISAVFLSSLIPVFFGFYDAALGGFASSNGFRINSTFNHPNILAFYLVLMISVGFYFYKAKVSFIPAWLRKSLPIYILIMFSLLLMTKTRSAWVACFVFFSVYAIIYERKYLVFIGLSLVGALMIPEIRDRVLDLSQGNEVVNYSKLNSYAWRKLIWEDGLNWMSPSHYFFGYGLESFRLYSVNFFSMAGGTQSGAHSVFVQLFFETGVFGLSAFIWLHLRVAMLLIPFYKTNKLMIFSGWMFLLEFAFYSYADNMLSYLSFNWYLWFVLGAVYAVNLSKHEKLILDSAKSD
ncbi:O-antigen ligase [Methylotenera sp.]|uniref:O-antigen ligase family protein n=1 Tax=Methylotenera sp. TaxID=2051956 RepID=UPI0025D11E18|nr:O-antigen ligase family protein [Methylotenera sp.]